MNYNYDVNRQSLEIQISAPNIVFKDNNDYISTKFTIEFRKIKNITWKYYCDMDCDDGIDMSPMICSPIYLYSEIGSIVSFNINEEDDDDLIETKSISEVEVLNTSMTNSSKLIKSIQETVEESIASLGKEQMGKLGDVKNKIKKQKKLLNKNIETVLDLIKLDGIEDTKQEKRYTKLMVALQLLQKNSNNIWQSSFSHVDNNHKAPSAEHMEDLLAIAKKLNNRLELSKELLLNFKSEDCEAFDKSSNEFEIVLAEFDKKQIKRMKNSHGSMKNNFLFLDLYSYMENISHHLGRLVTLYCKNYKNLQ